MALREAICQTCNQKVQWLEGNQIKDNEAPSQCPLCRGPLRRLISRMNFKQTMASQIGQSDLRAAYYEHEAFEPHFPHWDESQRALGVKVSADEMFRAGKAVDALASEWTPCRSDADKEAEYAEEADHKLLLADVQEALTMEAQGATAQDFEAVA